MDQSLTVLRIDQERFKTRFEALAQIGATPEGGVHRPALSQAHLEARRWFLEQARQSGFETKIDGAGNHSAILRCGPADGPTLLLGSHLDSVPYGGRFDGALGVMAGLEVLEVVREQGLNLPAHLEAIDFTDEEGHYIGLMGSQAVAGILKRDRFENVKGSDFPAALARAGLSPESILAAARSSPDVAGYLELHVEQGLRLLNQGAQVGIVTGIVGIRSYWLRFIGRADHAGTTPMLTRLDAGQGASAFTVAARDLVLDSYPNGVVNVGQMIFEPGAFNVVPERVTLALEFRANDSMTLDEMEIVLLQQAANAADRFRLRLETRPLERVAPSPMAGKVQAAFANSCQTLGLKQVHLASGAGHDAQSLAHICPAGMIFVPSVGGFSHSAREFTEWADCVNGANTLLQAALDFLSNI
jgi:N-carbamoyl-L-amino-acid hydrolase